MRGTRSRLPVSWSVGGDHPRVCGEHVRDLPFVLVHAGSSPRMRGTPFSGSLLIAWLGIIPAYAGNTWNRCFGITSVWDHPRVCGEHFRRFLASPMAWGSSPRMRGTHSDWRRRYRCNGIIPAYAGNTLRHWISEDAIWDHPRVCGEHLGLPYKLPSYWGSSPRMRGTPLESCENR